MSVHIVLGFSGEYGPGEHNHLGFLGIKFDAPFGTPHCQF